LSDGVKNPRNKRQGATSQSADSSGINSRIFKILEYDKITALLAEQTSGMAAARAASDLEPVTDVYEISARQKETEEAVFVIAKKGALPLGEYGDITRDADFADKGGSLTMEALLGIARHLNIVRTAAAFISSDVPAENIPVITSAAGVMSANKALEDRIRTSILSDTEMADSASPELKRIRREQIKQGDAVRAHLNKFITSQAYRDILQDQLVTIRDGRYVIPVRQEFRHKIAGLVHDRSKGGATLFIEPQAVVESNNKLRELEIEEEREVERILAELSAMVGAMAAALRVNQDTLVKLDLIFAKGKLAWNMDAVRPEIGGADGADVLEIKDGRHPLIDAKKVVPVSLSIGGGYRTLVITGPNTGGKTVTLKTVGLFILMAQAGLHVPAAGARIPFVSEVFADSGDEQSIEQSLSTFSSHMKNIVEIVKRAGRGSFVFLDELGAGTDPTEGAALAIAILESLNEKGAMIFATTHYTELKKYALATDSAMNASMEFDVETLSPTYRLRIGTPGRSNAFEISRKLGLPAYVVDRAEESMDGESVRFDEVIESVETDRIKAERERAEAEEIRAALEREREKLARKNAELDKSRDSILAKAREKAEQSIDDAREYADIIKEELRAVLADAEDFAAGIDDDAPARGDLFRRIDENKKLLNSIESDVTKPIQKRGKKKRGFEPDADSDAKPLRPADIKIGAKVKYGDIDEPAEVLALPNEHGDVRIRAGILRMTVPVNSLTRADNGSEEGVSRRSGVENLSKYIKNTQQTKQTLSPNKNNAQNSLIRSKVSSVTPSVNVIGNPLDEAKLIVEKYLDDAALAGLSEVTVIHGLGAGILRDGLRPWLRKHRYVKSVRAGGPGEGGDGATVVIIK
jgi:DNA mismatch repair protein MutS2